MITVDPLTILNWALTCSLLCAVPVHAESVQHTNIYDSTICSPDGVALGGYDVVTYWTQSIPVAGSAALADIFEESTYWFSSLKNRALFQENPKKYLPKYRSWCSATLAAGRLACPDYTNFKIENGELLLFEVVGFTNGRDVWNSDPLKHKRNADLNFERFTRE